MSVPAATSTRIMHKATDVFGSAGAAAAFVQRPALGLDGRHPADLMRMLDGAMAVETFLHRLDTCTYT